MCPGWAGRLQVDIVALWWLDGGYNTILKLKEAEVETSMDEDDDASDPLDSEDRKIIFILKDYSELSHDRSPH
jgi:hypothetical protein